MKGMMGCVALTATAMAFAPMQADAQMGQRGRFGPGPRQGGPGVEHVMRLSGELELTENQLTSLEGIRAEVVDHRNGHQALMADLRSRVRAGQLEPEAAREQMLAVRETASAFSEEIRGRVESILTDDQKAQLQDLVRERRAYQRGRASVQRRGPRGMQRGGAFRGDRLRGRSGGERAWRARGGGDPMWSGRGPGG